jgi:hypothetical protein
MLTIEALNALGVDTADGLERCMKNEAFYFRLIGKALGDPSFDELAAAIGAKDLDRAFELAHSLKGVLSNLSLTPMAKAASEMTELLRARTDTDYTPYVDELISMRDRLRELNDN